MSGPAPYDPNNYVNTNPAWHQTYNKPGTIIHEGTNTDIVNINATGGGVISIDGPLGIGKATYNEYVMTGGN